MSRLDEPKLFRALNGLPLFDNVFMSMQARNVALVDRHLQDLEAAMVREYMQTDQTPLPALMMVNALSQFWIFGVYELLRTWRQRVTELLAYAKDLRSIPRGPKGMPEREKIRTRYRPKAIPLQISQEFADAVYGADLEKVESDPAFVRSLQRALDQVTLRFRRLEALRMTLAKHEVKGGRGVRAYAPGYARIDSLTDSLCWMVEYKDGSSEMVSRRDIVQELESLSGRRQLSN